MSNLSTSIGTIVKSLINKAERAGGVRDERREEGREREGRMEGWKEGKKGGRENRGKGRRRAEEVDYKFREEDMKIYLYII